MIYDVYILVRDGRCILHRKYGSLEADEDLVSGFLSALSSFGKNISGEEVESINFGDKKFVSIPSEHLIFVSYSDKEDEVGNVLSHVRDDFISYYGPLREWDGERGVFKNFLATLDEIVGAKGKEGIFHLGSTEEILNNLKQGNLSAKEATDRILDYYLKKSHENKEEQEKPESRKLKSQIGM
ncbi:MAG: hypothetical protein WED07_05150 [Candidatus Freyarchaeum deiterrae]